MLTLYNQDRTTSEKNEDLEWLFNTITDIENQTTQLLAISIASKIYFDFGLNIFKTRKKDPILNNSDDREFGHGLSLNQYIFWNMFSTIALSKEQRKAIRENYGMWKEEKMAMITVIEN